MFPGVLVGLKHSAWPELLYSYSCHCLMSQLCKCRLKEVLVSGTWMCNRHRWSAKCSPSLIFLVRKQSQVICLNSKLGEEEGFNFVVKTLRLKHLVEHLSCMCEALNMIPWIARTGQMGLVHLYRVRASASQCDTPMVISPTPKCPVMSTTSWSVHVVSSSFFVVSMGGFVLDITRTSSYKVI